MFVWHKRSGEPARTRVYLWPLVVSLLLSVILTVLVNKVL